MINEIYDSGDIPEDLRTSIFIALPNKPGLNKCPPPTHTPENLYEPRS